MKTMKPSSKITRRDFLKIASLVGGSTVLGSCADRLPSPAERTPSPDAPNIILILTDDQPPDTIDFMPALQRELVWEGVNFNSSYATTPLCSPSRVSILTGQYAHNHGVLKNRYPNGGAEAFDDSSTVATWLHEAGYRTSFIGKYINGYDDLETGAYIPPGWDDWHVFLNGKSEHRFYYNYSMNENGQIVHYDEREEHYSNDIIAQKAIDFIRKSANQAFFLMVSFYAPHQPGTSAKRHNDMFKTDEQISPRRPPNFNEQDISDKPAWVDTEMANPHSMDKAYQKSLRTLMSVDEAISGLLEALRDIRQEDNTAIIYYSDNGEAWGEHRLKQAKNCPYEACSRVPLVIAYPNAVSAPRSEHRLVANIDLAPTIANLAGVTPPSWVDGASLLPILKGSSTDWRESILIEHWPTDEGHGSTIPEFSAIRTQEWKYVEYTTGERELYDLVSDPYEMQNLANLGEHEETMVDLAARLAALRKE